MAGKNYISAKNSVTRVGLYVAGFIKQLKENFGIRLEKVKFVGHSLGAHICGNSGAALGGKVDRIVGLDPAGPLFTVKNIDNRLDRSDAKFVQVIHTNGGTLGFRLAMGHAEYFPNEGESQPGCRWDMIGTCSHSRAYAYYSESLLRNFYARRCTDFKHYKKGNCNIVDANDFSAMGRFKVDYNARGSYYLLTNSKPPYYARG
uniref:Pancreatic lipase-related protein 3-like isoform X2 n=1 Tax=Diabrotica virgifera virgifera TaxID=50390 RepID=A0A6P7GIA5_DIAVI